MREARILDRVALLRRDGRRRRLRVQLPPIALGVVVALAGASLWSTSRDSEREIIALMCLYSGLWVALLALRPQDVRAVRAMIVFTCAIAIGGVAVVFHRHVERARTLPAAAVGVGDDYAPGVYHDVPVFVGVPLAGCLWMRALYADLALRASPRVTLNRAWAAVGTGLLSKSVSIVAHVHWVASRRGPAIELLLLVALTVETALLGALCFWRPLRTRVQELLARLGESISAAAGIAELIGGLPPAVVLERARQTFRAVPLGLITVDHMRTTRRSARASSEWRASCVDARRASRAAPVAASRKSSPARAARAAPAPAGAARDALAPLPARPAPSASSPVRVAALDAVATAATAAATAERATHAGCGAGAGARQPAGAAEPNLAISSPVVLGAVDAFISHRCAPRVPLMPHRLLRLPSRPPARPHTYPPSHPHAHTSTRPPAHTQHTPHPPTTRLARQLARRRCAKARGVAGVARRVHGDAQPRAARLVRQAVHRPA